MCNCNPVIPLSEKAMSINKCLKILFFFFLIVVVLQLVFQNFNNAFSSIITVIVFVLAFIMCHYLIAGFLIFMIMFDIYFSLTFIGLRIQNKVADLPDPFITSKGMFIAILTIESAIILFLIFTIYHVFQAFKEFKAIHLGYDRYSI